MGWAWRMTAACVAAAVAAAPVPGAAQAAGDPPGRVGRLPSLSGTVSFHLADAQQWEPATLNLPVTTGSAFWTEPGAAASLGVARNRIVLDQSTELDVTRLDDRSMALTLPQGAVFLRMQDLAPGDSASVQTPRGTVVVATVGRYEVVAGDAGRPTTVTVVDGAADVIGAGAPVHVGANQTATLTGDGTASPLQASLGPAQHDPFLAAALAAERPAPRAAAAPAFVARMTGGEALEEYGEWATTPAYGAVWYPRAEPGFVPYRNGHWAYVAPWGWTWVDDAPWGFAPSHYGRWVEVGERWGWLPGPAPVGFARPVYAPAVVSFLAGAAVGAAFVSWAPLGPREPYRPPYRASNIYIRNLNIGAPLPPGGAGFGPALNRAAFTSVPAAAMIGSQRLGAVARPLPPEALGRGAVWQPRPPVAPTLATTGATPGLIRRMNLLQEGGPARPAAPGPALVARPGGPGAEGPAGRPPEAAGGVGPGAALGGAAAGALLMRPGAGRFGPAAGPPLRPADGSPDAGPRGGAPGPAIGPRPDGPGDLRGARPPLFGAQPPNRPELRPDGPAARPEDPRRPPRLPMVGAPPPIQPGPRPEGPAPHFEARPPSPAAPAFAPRSFLRPEPQAGGPPPGAAWPDRPRFGHMPGGGAPGMAPARPMPVPAPSRPDLVARPMPPARPQSFAAPHAAAGPPPGAARPMMPPHAAPAGAPPPHADSPPGPRPGHGHDPRQRP